MDVLKVVERLQEIRQLKKALENEEKELRDSLARLAAASGGRLIVGGFILTLVQAETYQYGEILKALKARHPQLEGEISELSEKFKTAYSRLTIERLS
jgi:mevalonate pyrophosphate decarboxylase